MQIIYRHKIIIIIVCVISATTIYYSNRDVFMSVRQMLSTGYVYMPDFRHRIRGHACRSCDTRVIQFKDVITLIDLMDDTNPTVGYRAKWAFNFLINRHLLDQFGQNNTPEQASFAIDAIRYLYSKSPDKYLLSNVYHILHSESEYKPKNLLKQAPLYEARAIFETFCKDFWGERLTIYPQKTNKGKFTIASDDNKRFITTTSSWIYYKHTIIEHTPGPTPPADPNIVPIACFDKDEDIYQLLDYKLSIKAAASYNDSEGLDTLINRNPETLKYMAYVKDRHLNHNNNVLDGQLIPFLNKKYDEIAKANGSYKQAINNTNTEHYCGTPKFPDAETLLKRLPDAINNNFKSSIVKHPNESQGATLSYLNKNRDLVTLSVNIKDRKPDAYPFYMYTDWRLTENEFERNIKTRYELEEKGILYKDIVELERSEVTLLDYKYALYGRFTYLYDHSNNNKYINIQHHYVALGVNSYMINIRTYHNEPVAKKDIINLSNTILGFILEGIDGR